MAIAEINNVIIDSTEPEGIRFSAEFNFRVDAGYLLDKVIMYDMDGTENVFNPYTCGLVPAEAGETSAEQTERSLIANRGIVLVPQNRDGTKLKVVMITKCKGSDNTKIGFHSGKLEFVFKNGNDSCSCTYDVKMFPRIIRGEIYQAEPGDDPILPTSNARYGYDFGIDGIDTADKFYANTYGNGQNCVPRYEQKLSAYSFSMQDPAGFGYMYDWDNASSFLLNTGTGEKFPVDYEKVYAGTVSFEPVSGYSADMMCYEITQSIEGRFAEYHANELRFDVNLNALPTVHIGEHDYPYRRIGHLEWTVRNLYEPLTGNMAFSPGSGAETKYYKSCWESWIPDNEKGIVYEQGAIVRNPNVNPDGHGEYYQQIMDMLPAGEGWRLPTSADCLDLGAAADGAWQKLTLEVEESTNELGFNGQRVTMIATDHSALDPGHIDLKTVFIIDPPKIPVGSGDGFYDQFQMYHRNDETQKMTFWPDRTVWRAPIRFCRDVYEDQ